MLRGLMVSLLRTLRYLNAFPEHAVKCLLSFYCLLVCSFRKCYPWLKKRNIQTFQVSNLFWLRGVFTALCGLLIAVASLTAELGSRVCGLQQPWPENSLIAVPGLQSTGSMLWHMGSGALWHVGSSSTRDQTPVLCIGGQIPNHCTAREVPKLFNFWSFLGFHSINCACNYMSIIF